MFFIQNFEIIKEDDNTSSGASAGAPVGLNVMQQMKAKLNEKNNQSSAPGYSTIEEQKVM